MQVRHDIAAQSHRFDGGIVKIARMARGKPDARNRKFMQILQQIRKTRVRPSKSYRKRRFGRASYFQITFIGQSLDFFDDFFRGMRTFLPRYAERCNKCKTRRNCIIC